MWKFIDQLFDDVSRRLAANMVNSAEIAEQNRIARELSELSDPQLREAGISRQKLQQGSKAFPWTVAANDEVSLQELQQRLSQPLSKKQLRPDSQFILSA